MTSLRLNIATEETDPALESRIGHGKLSRMNDIVLMHHTSASTPLTELFSRRNVVAILAFFGFFNILALRGNLSIAIVAMTQKYEIVKEPGVIEYIQDFDWNSKEKGIILSSFFYGYVLTQIIGGWLGTKFGGAYLYGIGILVTSVLNLLIPLVAYLGIEFIILVRVMEGIFEGITFPCMHTVWAKWAPPKERTRLATFAISGGYVGVLVTFPTCGFFAQHFGWPSIFYITSAAALVWCLIWFLCVTNDPADDRWISESELKYIKNSLPTETERRVIFPWKSFFTSMPVWAIICAHFCETWGFYIMLTQLPAFLIDVLHFDIQSVGFLSAIPYLAMAIALPIGGLLVDWVRRQDRFTTTQVRKFTNCLAFVVQGICITASVFMDSAYVTIMLVTFGLAIGIFSWTGFGVNHLDIAPQHAGILMGITNTFATFSGFLGPTLAGYVTQNKTKTEWRIVFCIIGAINLFSALFYGMFASGEVQSWALNKNYHARKLEEIKEEMENATSIAPSSVVKPLFRNNNN